MAYERKDFVGNAATAQLSAGIDAGTLTLSIDDATNWPTGDFYPFVIAVDLGLATEEKILCTERTGTVLTVRSGTGRGHDGTTPQAHALGATVDHVLDAETIDQVNRLANLMTLKGSIIASNGTNPVALASGAVDATTDGRVLSLKWSTGTGLTFERHISLIVDANAPPVDGSARMWYDLGSTILRPSDGDSWLIPTQLIRVANDTERDALFAAPSTGHAVWREDVLVIEVYNGTRWQPVGPVRVADVTERNAYYADPEPGDQAYTADTDTLYLYRGSAWVILSNTITIADTQPSGQQVGDLWVQPVD